MHKSKTCLSSREFFQTALPEDNRPKCFTDYRAKVTRQFHYPAVAHIVNLFPYKMLGRIDENIFI